jgi:hypothetical protein
MAGFCFCSMAASTLAESGREIMHMFYFLPLLWSQSLFLSMNNFLNNVRYKYVRY